MADQLTSDLASLRIQRDIDPDRRSPLRAVAAIVVVLGAGAGAAVYGYPRVKGQIFKTEVAVTEVALISPAQASISVTSTGYLVPQILSHIGAKVSGKVARSHVKESDSVKAGSVLIELEDADQRSAVAASQAHVTAARARANAARAAALELRPQIDREQKLVALGANPRATLDDLVAKERSLQVTAQASDADIHSAETDVRTLQVNLRDLVITAPIDGTVLNKPPQAGDMVGPGAPLFDLADFGSIMIETDVPEARVHLLKVGTPCEVVLDAYPDKRDRGAVAELGKRVDRAKATLMVKVKFVDKVPEALPEMSARVSFLTEELSAEAMKAPPKRVVPAAAVTERAGAKVVFVVDQGKVRMVPVTVSGPVGSDLELVDGPAPGTRLVSGPSPELVDGQGVKEKDKGDG